MSKYIDAKDLVFEIDNTPTPTGFLSIDYIKEMIDALPTEDVAPIIHAKWTDNTNGTFTCSNCNGKASRGNYCPRCGARMDKLNTAEDLIYPKVQMFYGPQDYYDADRRTKDED